METNAELFFSEWRVCGVVKGDLEGFVKGRRSLYHGCPGPIHFSDLIFKPLEPISVEKVTNLFSAHDLSLAIAKYEDRVTKIRVRAIGNEAQLDTQVEWVLFRL